MSRARSGLQVPRKMLARALFILMFLYIGDLFSLAESTKKGPIFDDGLDGQPCICDGMYYQICPPFLSCRERRPASGPASGKLPYLHDDDHPDHADEQPESGVVQSPLVWHRKVYVTDKDRVSDGPKIHPISLTIPIEDDDNTETFLVPPKPMYKMREYTRIVKKPETEFIPMKTTVIKPANVLPSQIIKS